MLLYVEKIVALSSRYITFEPNDSATWRTWKNLVRPVFRDIQAKRGLQNFEVIMDSTTVTTTAQENNEMPGRIFIEPTKAAEKIQLDFVLTPQGAEFEELTTAL
jgi:phage tail sheath protein FI